MHLAIEERNSISRSDVQKDALLGDVSMYENVAWTSGSDDRLRNSRIGATNPEGLECSTEQTIAD